MDKYKKQMANIKRAINKDSAKVQRLTVEMQKSLAADYHSARIGTEEIVGYYDTLRKLGCIKFRLQSR